MEMIEVGVVVYSGCTLRLRAVDEFIAGSKYVTGVKFSSLTFCGARLLRRFPRERRVLTSFHVVASWTSLNLDRVVAH